MKKHLGFWFILWCLETNFLLGLAIPAIHMSELAKESFALLWFGVQFYFIVYLHGKWIASKFSSK